VKILRSEVGGFCPLRFDLMLFVIAILDGRRVFVFSWVVIDLVLFAVILLLDTLLLYI
jgi:hypothetical protein